MSQSLKVVFVGDEAVGKTYLLESYALNASPGQYVPSKTSKTYPVSTTVDGKSTYLELWDTPGQEKYDTEPIPAQADVIVMCFDIVMQSSLQAVKDKWLARVQERAPKVPIVILGLKLDLRDDSVVTQKLKSLGLSSVSYEQGKQVADEIGAVRYIECSALTRENLEEAFKEIVTIHEP